MVLSPVLPLPRDGMNSIPQEGNVGNQRSRERQQGTKNQIISMRGMKELVKTPQPGREITGVCERSLQSYKRPWGWLDIGNRSSIFLFLTRTKGHQIKLTGAMVRRKEIGEDGTSCKA